MANNVIHPVNSQHQRHTSILDSPPAISSHDASRGPVLVDLTLPPPPLCPATLGSRRTVAVVHARTESCTSSPSSGSLWLGKTTKFLDRSGHNRVSALYVQPRSCGPRRDRRRFTTHQYRRRSGTPHVPRSRRRRRRFVFPSPFLQSLDLSAG